MLTDRLDDSPDYPGHVAVVLGSDTSPATVRDFYVWCDELGVEAATVCLPYAADRDVYAEAVADLHPPVRTVDGTETPEGSRFLSYIGGRDELVAAFRRIAEDVDEGRLSSDEIDAEAVEERLALPGEPDLLIEAAGEPLSDALVWQTVYSELCHVEEFDRSALVGCLEDYTERERRYGR